MATRAKAGNKTKQKALTDNQLKHRELHKNQGGYGEEITGDDSSDLIVKKAELYIGTKGHVKVTLHGGTVVTLKNVPSGTFLRGIYVNKVFATGTTARDIVAIY
tara:strand:+ start:4748 stop:5059 length:312 start_codon:yes stop_codon:yes gene_type:complete